VDVALPLSSCYCGMYGDSETRALGLSMGVSLSDSEQVSTENI